MTTNRMHSTMSRALLFSFLFSAGCAPNKKHHNTRKPSAGADEEYLLTHEQKSKTLQICRKIHGYYSDIYKIVQPILELSKKSIPEPYAKAAFEEFVLKILKVLEKLDKERLWDPTRVSALISILDPALVSPLDPRLVSKLNAILVSILQLDPTEISRRTAEQAVLDKQHARIRASIAYVLYYALVSKLPDPCIEIGMSCCTGLNDLCATIVKNPQKTPLKYKAHLKVLEELFTIIEELDLFFNNLTVTKLSEEEYRIQYGEYSCIILSGYLCFKRGTILLAGSQLNRVLLIKSVDESEDVWTTEAPKKVLSSALVLSETWRFVDKCVLKDIKLKKGVEPSYDVKPEWKRTLDGMKDDKLLLLYRAFAAIIADSSGLQRSEEIRNLIERPLQILKTVIDKHVAQKVTVCLQLILIHLLDRIDP